MTYPYTPVVTTLAVFGALTNTLCASLMWRHRRRLGIDSIGYIINQCLLDLSAALLILVSNYNLGEHITLGDGGHLNPDSHWHDFLCKVWISELPVWSTLMCSTCNLIILTVERYLVVVHPIWHKNHMTPTKTKVLYVIPWFFGPVFHSMFLNTSRIVNGKCLWTLFYPNIEIARTVAGLKLIFEFFGPVAIMIYCYVAIWLIVRKREKRVAASRENTLARAGGGATIAFVEHDSHMVSEAQQTTELTENRAAANPADSDTGENNTTAKYSTHLAIPTATTHGEKAGQDGRPIKVNKTVIKTVATICIVYICCWTTKDILLLLKFAFRINYPKNSPVFAFGITSLFMQCCINPFIYILKLPSIRKYAKKDIIRIREKLCPATK